MEAILIVIIVASIGLAMLAALNVYYYLDALYVEASFRR